MNMEIGTEAAQFLFWEHINRNIFAVNGCRVALPVEEPDLLGAGEGGEDLVLLRGHVALLVPDQHGLINYMDTKAKCRHLKKLTSIRRCLSEFIDWKYSQSSWYFRPSFVNHLTFSLVQLSAPLPLPCVNKYTIFTYTVCKGRGGSGPQTDKHLPQSPFTDQLFIWRHFELPSMSPIFQRWPVSIVLVLFYREACIMRKETRSGGFGKFCPQFAKARAFRCAFWSLLFSQGFSIEHVLSHLYRGVFSQTQNRYSFFTF